MSKWWSKKKGGGSSDASAPTPPSDKKSTTSSRNWFGDSRDPNSMEVKWDDHESHVGSRRRMGEKLEYARWMKSHKIFSMPTKTPDGEYEAAFAQFEKLEDSLVACGLQLCKYQKSLRKCSGSMMLLSTAFGQKGCDQKIEPPGTEHFIQASETMKSNLDQKLIAAMENRVLSPMLEKAQAMDGVIKQALKRAIAKCEYDYYFEKYRGLQEKGADTEKAKERLVRNQQNAQTSAAELKRLTEPLLKTFRKYLELGDRILAPEFETLKAAHQVYYSLTAKTFEKLESRNTSGLKMPSLSDATSQLSKMNPFGGSGGGGAASSDDDLMEGNSNGQSRSAPALPAASEPAGKKYQAMYDYDTTESDELALKRMDIIIVTDDSDASWWRGECNGREGLFPANYVEPFTGL
eukprot:g2438.t1